MSQKLYTAAEARRIDIKRGGEGWIQDLNGDKFFYREDRMDWSYTKEALPVLLNGLRQCWLPITPEPEQDEAKYYAGFSWDRVRGMDLDIKNLQDAKEQLEKELAEYKDNYHEILADHGELTRQFDELTEKGRWKSISEIPRDGQTVRYRGPRATGFYSAQSDKWWLEVNGGAVPLDRDCIETWTWKYEADL